MLMVGNLHAKPKLSINVFTNKETCWSCFRSLNTYSKLKLENMETEITMFFCSKDDSMMTNLIKQYEIPCKATTDPECLYAKKYGMTRLPGIVIKDKERDSILIKENWGNPKAYLQLMKDYDANYKPVTKKEPEYLSPAIIIKDKDNNPIKMQYMEVAYNKLKDKYYCFINGEQNISVIDGEGKVIDEINILEMRELEDSFNNRKPVFLNDSVLVWIAYDKKKNGEQNIIGLNINTHKIVKKGKIELSYATENSFIEEYNVVEGKNKIVLSRYYFDNGVLDINDKLLVLSDTNLNSVKNFGKVDPICTKTTMAASKMTSYATPTSYDGKIYQLLSLSNQLFEYDSEGNYIKTIELDFEENYNPALENIPVKTNADEEFEIFAKYKFATNTVVQKDRIIVCAFSNITNEHLSLEQYYYITMFDRNGKRIKDTFKLPKDCRVEGEINNGRILITQKQDNGTMAIRWVK